MRRSRPRVLLVTNSSDRGSTSRTLESWARLLPHHGVEPVVTIGGPGPLQDALSAAGVSAHIHRIRQVFTVRRPVPFLLETWRLAARIRSSGADLVHVNEHEHYQVPARAAHLAGVPVVVHIRFRPEPPMCQWLFKRPCTPQRVFFTSRTQMDDCGDAVASAVATDRFRLVYNGLDFETFGRDTTARERLRCQWAVGPDTFVIGTASSISPRKRIDHVIRAVALLAQSGIDVRGFIAGRPYFPEDEVELARLRQLAGDLGVAARVIFLGYVDPSEPLYHAWDVCVSASEYETFGMTALEAMACGCPIVAYPGGSVAEVVGDGGVLVPDGDVQALTAAIRALAVCKEALLAAGTKAKQRAQVFNVRRSVDMLVAEYRAVLGPAAG